MSSIDSSDTTEWARGELERLKVCFADANTVADKLALIRSMVRLSGGRMDKCGLPDLSLATEVEEGLRFGLGIGPSVIRLLDETDNRAPDGFWDAQDLDLSLRRHRDHLPPDAVLLRYTDHPDYRSEGQKAAVRSPPPS